MAEVTDQHDDCGDPAWTWEEGLPREIWQKYFYGPPEPTERQWEDMEFQNEAV